MPQYTVKLHSDTLGVDRFEEVNAADETAAGTAALALHTDDAFDAGYEVLFTRQLIDTIPTELTTAQPWT